MKAGEIDGTSDFIVLGTILHEDSLLSKLLDHNISPDWEKKKFQAVESFATNQGLWDIWKEIYLTHENEEEAAEAAWEFYKKNEEAMLEGVKVLWPEGESYYDLMVMCLTPEGESAFLSEKQNDPIDITRVEIRPEDIKTFTVETFNRERIVRLEEEDREHPSLLRKFDGLTFFGAWDPSKGKKAKIGDYSAIVTIGKDRNGIIYVVDVDLKRKDIDSRIEDILRLHKKYNYRLFVVETAAFQYFAKDVLVKRAKAVGSDLRFKIKEDTGQSDKDLRIRGLAPYIVDGTIRFLHSSQWSGTKGIEYRNAIKQLVGYGAGAKHDDFPDALAMVFELVKYGVFKRKALIDGKTVVIGR
jgi:predicted phage terminase large subunit-like protein